MTAILYVLAPFLPLVMALLMVPIRWRPTIARLLPAAPLPALALALAGEPGDTAELPYALLGVTFGLDATRLPLLLMTALLWIAAALYGRGYLPSGRQSDRYNALFLVTMAGNVGLVVALDAATFYVFFSLMTLSAYILVVHQRTAFAYYAGRVYIVLSLVGETMLLFGLLRAAAAAGSVLIADISAALADEGEHGLTLLLLFGGLAIKAGQLPLHVWLPLAHPVAPTPASAVLSGAIVKAGILGMMLLLPFGEAPLPLFGWLLTGIGLISAFYGVAAGLPQTNPKTVLAYSTVSQMGLLVAALGGALAVPAAAPALLAAAALYAVHHGLAKGALFLSVGVVEAGCRGRAAALGLAGLAALAIAGLPLTAGALVKDELKYALEGTTGDAALLVAGLMPWSATATGLLMLRFLYLLRGVAAAGGRPERRVEALLWAPFALLAAASQLLPWTVAVADPARPGGPAVAGAALWEGLWPIALAVALAGAALVLAARWPRLRLPRVPEGDLVALMPSGDALAEGWSCAYQATIGRLAWPTRLAARLADAGARAVERGEGLARAAPAAGLVLLALLLAYAAA